MYDFLNSNFFQTIAILIGGFIALVVYKLNKSEQRANAAKIIVIQIRDIREKIIALQKCIDNGEISVTPFFESDLIISENYWDIYKHQFIKDMGLVAYTDLDKFYACITHTQRIQKEIQLFINNQLKDRGYFYSMNLASLYAEYSRENLFTQEEINKADSSFKYKHDNFLKKFNSNDSYQYIPKHYGVTLESLLKEYSLLNIEVANSYLNKIAKIK